MPRALLALILVLLALNGTARAAPAETAHEIAERVDSAYAAGERPLLSALRGTPYGPWVIAEELCFGAAHSAAHALAAEAADNPVHARLPAYVKWRIANAADSQVAARWRAIESIHRTATPAEILARMKAEEAPASGVMAARWRRLFARVLGEAKPPPAVRVAAHRQAGDACAKIGWHAGAMHEYAAGMYGAIGIRANEEALALAHALIPVAKEGQSADAELRGHAVAARALRALGRRSEALPHARARWGLASTTRRRRDALKALLLLEMETGTPYKPGRDLATLRALETELGNDVGVAVVDLRRAVDLADMGRLTEAVALIRDVVEYLDARGKPGHRRGAHLNAAHIALRLRDWARAREHVRKARVAGEGLGYNEGTLDVIEGTVDLMERRYDDAVAAFRKALPQLGRADLDERFSAHRNLAEALGAMGRLEEAEQTLAEARALLTENAPAIYRLHLASTLCTLRLLRGDVDGAIAAGEEAWRLRVPGSATASDALVTTRLAVAWWRKGDAARALELATEATQIVLDTSSTLPDRLGAQHRSELQRCFAWGIQAAASMKDVSRVFAFAEQERAVALRTRLVAGDLLHRALPDLEATEGQLVAAEARAVGAYRRAAASGDAERVRDAETGVGAARAALDAHRDRMHATRAVAAQVLHPRVDSLDEVRARLGDDEALVVYAAGAIDVYAVVATKDAARLVRLGRRGAIENVIRTAVLSDARLPAAKAVSSLVTALTKPLALPADVKRVRIVPTRAVATVPFAALWGGRVTRFIPSATVERVMAARTTAGGKRVLAVAGSRTVWGAPLLHAEAEARAVGDAVHVGKAATEERLRALLDKPERWRSIHLACHGMIDPTHPLRSALALEPTEGFDGLWTVSEILGTRVSADLVGLSSCSTALGRIFNQEGTLGFVHAFLVAGADRVLVSAWDVDDEATAALMKAFYAAWQKGAPSAQALRAAQAAVRAQPRWKHPAFWSAWQLWGLR